MILHVFRCRFLFLSLLFSHSFLCSCSLLTVFSFFILWFCVLLKRVEYISIDISTSGAMSALVFNIQQSPFSTLWFQSFFLTSIVIEVRWGCKIPAKISVNVEIVYLILFLTAYNVFWKGKEETRTSRCDRLRKISIISLSMCCM